MFSKVLRRLRSAKPVASKARGQSPFSSVTKSATSGSNPSQQRPALTDFDPYGYTSGCWMRNDEAQRQARRVEFNFDSLIQKAIDSSPGAKEMLSCDKVEGNFNRAFIIRLDNGLKVVARIPFSVAGPQRLTTHSEVATMAYVRQHTSVPVPKVLDWNDDPNNSIGTEYIIMEHVPGVQLSRLWPEMDGVQHLECVKNLSLLVKQMHNLQFPAYGSIYFEDAPIGDSPRVKLATGFCIGPHCDNRYWPCLPGELRFYDRKQPNRGPWATFEEFTNGLLDAGLARIPPESTEPRLAYRGNVEDHLHLIAQSRSVLKALTENQSIRSVSSPALFHPDLHKRNIFVDPADPSKITALIDWQGASMDPVFFSAGERPDLCDYPESFDEFLREAGHESGPQETEESPERTKLREDVELCAKLWEVGLRGWAPKLYKARQLDRDLVHQFGYCYSSWRDSAVVFREGLMKLSRRWAELQLPGSCPYQPSDTDIVEHVAQMEDLKTAETLKEFLVRAFNCNEDGWLPTDGCALAKEARTAAFKQWMNTVDEDITSDAWRLNDSRDIQHNIQRDTYIELTLVNMSKYTEGFIGVFRSGNEKSFKKILGSHRLGDRIFPSRSSKNDAKHQLRIDAGPIIDGRWRQVCLQVNTQASSRTLKAWVRKFGSHANLAVADFDTQAEDFDEEADKLCREMLDQAKRKLEG
ncbi:hypothetical protein G7046_g10081 [Stylonectria norvegica]|nr:hypothetical protein G7046_g10081 [Stylonectria norvegica]